MYYDSKMNDITNKILSNDNSTSNDTRLHPMQPLRVIRDDIEESKKVNDEKKGEIKYETLEEDICNECQIPNILGNCKGCGIYQYTILTEKFDIVAKRRRQ